MAFFRATIHNSSASLSSARFSRLMASRLVRDDRKSCGDPVCDRQGQYIGWRRTVVLNFFHCTFEINGEAGTSNLILYSVSTSTRHALRWLGQSYVLNDATYKSLDIAQGNIQILCAHYRRSSPLLAVSRCCLTQYAVCYTIVRTRTFLHLKPETRNVGQGQAPREPGTNHLSYTN